MQIAYSVSAVLVFALVSCNRASDQREQPATAQPAPGVVTGKTDAGRTRLVIKTGDSVARTLLVDRDSTVSPQAELRSVVITGELLGRALVIVDAYPSTPGGASFCQAGEERFLRVIANSSPQPSETFRVKVASCWDNIELLENGITWQPDSNFVRINWLSGPGANHEAETRRVFVDRDGRAEVRPPE